jgi:hypothetical protein
MFNSYFMAIEEVWVCRIDIAGLHCDHIRHKLRCWCHSGLEETDDDTVETLAKGRIPAECLLETPQGYFRRRIIHSS